MQRKISAAIFDLDGTLANTIDDLLTSMNEMLRTLGCREIDRAHLLKAINHGTTEFIRMCLPDEYAHDDAVMEKAMSAYLAAYKKHYLEKTCFYDGINGALRKLKNSGFRLAVLSNKNDDMVKKIIARLSDGDIFDLIWGYLELPHKPDPSSALEIAKKMGVSPDEVAFIGDSDVDMKTAKNAGMIPVGVTWGYRDEDILRKSGAEIIISSPETLASLSGKTL